jgi:hypothetical protein
MSAMCREVRAPPRTPIFSPISTKVRAAKALWSAEQRCAGRARDKPDRVDAESL